MQRFSGTGLTPRSVTQRQESRARATTLILAVVAVMLITTSALVLFNPTVQHPGFGFAFGQRITQVKSNEPLLLPGTPPPSPSPADGDTPTPTPPGNNGGNPTPLPQPTATTLPSPTPVPTVIPSGAVVHLTPATKSVNWSGTLSACPSGCNVPDQPLSASNTYTSTKSGTWVQDYAEGTLQLQEISAQGLLGWSGTIPPVQSNGSPWPCDSTFSGSFAVHAIKYFTCHVTGGAQFPANSINGYSDYVGDCNVGKCSFIVFSNPTGFGNYGHYTVTSNDCNTVINGANQQATSNGQGWGNSWMTNWLNQNPGHTEVWGVSVGYASLGCNPGPGYNNYPNFTITGSTRANATALVYRFSDAQQASISQLTATLPAHTSLQSSSPCPSGNLINVSNGSNSFAIQCSASGTEIWNWTSDTALQDSLKTQIAGKTKAQAEQICNSLTSEIVAGSCHIDFVGGNVSVVPSDTTKIQITVP